MLARLIERIRFARAESLIRCAECRTILDGTPARRVCSAECADRMDQRIRDEQAIW